jgi:hypothetical protein
MKSSSAALLVVLLLVTMLVLVRPAAAAAANVGKPRSNTHIQTLAILVFCVCRFVLLRRGIVCVCKQPLSPPTSVF